MTASKTQIDRLGERLRESTRIEDGDLQLLQDLRSDHAEALEEVARRLAEEVGLEPTTRLKTVGTIIDKLQRQPRLRLSQMQDVAGARVSLDVTLPAQDQIVETVRELFDHPRVVDRRKAPTHGYRAVHLVPSVQDRFVEIQVRTALQDLWAQLFERSADLVGRPIRYGERPRNEDIPAGIDLDGLMQLLDTLSAQIAAIEEARSLLESPGLDLFDVGRGQLSVELHRRERALRAGLRGLIAGLAVRYSSE